MRRIPQDNKKRAPPPCLRAATTKAAAGKAAAGGRQQKASRIMDFPGARFVQHRHFAGSSSSERGDRAHCCANVNSRVWATF